jgi:hypothetical protein
VRCGNSKQRPLRNRDADAFPSTSSASGAVCAAAGLCCRLQRRWLERSESGCGRFESDDARLQQTDNALVVGEAFKMLDGKIMMIQAIMAYMPSKAWN